MAAESDRAGAATVIEGARVLSLDDDGREWDCANIVVEGTRITAIGPEAHPVPEVPVERVIDARGKLAMPGLVNGHFHSPGNMMCGALVDMPLELFMLYEVPPMGSGATSPRLGYVLTMIGALEMLKSGVTAVHDDPYFNPAPATDGIDAIMQAYADSGMRATVSINFPNRIEYERYPFLRELLPHELIEHMQAQRCWTAAEITQLYRWFLQRWHEAHEGRLRIAVSNSAPQRVTPDYFAALSEFSRHHDLPFDIHILETKLQRVLGQEKFGKSLVRYVHDLGLLDERMLVIHAIWVNEADMQLLADSGCTVAHNPVCNLKIGSGVMPYRRLRDHGIPIALGTDERNTDDSTNMWGAMKMAGLIHKLAEQDYRRWPTASEVLECATRGSARGMRLDRKVGQLKPGYQADLILVDLDALAYTPLNDIRRQLVFCETGASVALTMVAGKVVVENGRVLTVDEAAIKAEARELSREFRHELERTAASAAALEPYYRAMYLRSVHTDVDMNRWLSP